MEDFQLIVYIIIGIIYLLSKLFKKSQKADSPVLPSKPIWDEFDSDTEPESNKTLPRPAYDPFVPATPKRETVEYENLEEKGKKFADARPIEEYRSLYEEKIINEDAEVKRLLGKRKKEADAMKIGGEKAKDTSLVKQPYSYKEETTIKEAPNKYAALLQNKNAAREAFILTEIFNRKY